MSSQGKTTAVLSHQLTTALAQDGLAYSVGPHTISWLCSVAEILCLYQELGVQSRVPVEPDLLDLIHWAYSKLHKRTYTRQEDALMLDRIKLLLKHGTH